MFKGFQLPTFCSASHILPNAACAPILETVSCRPILAYMSLILTYIYALHHMLQSSHLFPFSNHESPMI